MGVRAVIAAAALAVGVGQAEAATLSSNVAITMTQNYLECWYGSACGRKPQTHDWLGMKLGQVVYGHLIVTEYDGGGADITLMHYDGRRIFHEEMNGSDGNYWMMEAGFGMDLSWNGSRGGFYYMDDGYPWERTARGSFEWGLPAPIPLPASAAFLPVGLAALAMIRKRRKAA